MKFLWSSGLSLQWFMEKDGGPSTMILGILGFGLRWKRKKIEIVRVQGLWMMRSSVSAD